MNKRETTDHVNKLRQRAQDASDVACIIYCKHGETDPDYKRTKRIEKHAVKSLHFLASDGCEIALEGIAAYERWVADKTTPESDAVNETCKKLNKAKESLASANRQLVQAIKDDYTSLIKELEGNVSYYEKVIKDAEYALYA